MARRNRTRRGTVTAKARTRYGDRHGKFPVFDRRSAQSAIRLRGHGNRRKVLDKVSRWANRTGDTATKKKVAAARARDRRRS